MFDSLMNADGQEWQTKAFDCNLDVYSIGDTIPADTAMTYQVEVCAGGGSVFDGTRWFKESLATVRSNILVSVDDARDDSLPLVGFSGGLIKSAWNEQTNEPGCPRQACFTCPGNRCYAKSNGASR